MTASTPRLPVAVMTGGQENYPACQQEARALRADGARALLAPSAALVDSQTTGYMVHLRLRQVRQDAQVLVLFGRRPQLVGWLAAGSAEPPAEVLPRVRPLSTQATAARPRRVDR